MLAANLKKFTAVAPAARAKIKTMIASRVEDCHMAPATRKRMTLNPPSPKKYFQSVGSGRNMPISIMKTAMTPTANIALPPFFICTLPETFNWFVAYDFFLRMSTIIRHSGTNRSIPSPYIFEGIDGKENIKNRSGAYESDI